MSQPPILVLQMQRMGDLILTFPLLALLHARYPGHPIWTVAEPRFFQDLHPFCPPTVFFPPEASERLRTVHYRAVINLSHRADAAALCGAVSTDARFGTYDTDAGRYIDGYWGLYRASIVHNNRHNLFHWSDLQLLDHCGSGPLPHFDPISTGPQDATLPGPASAHNASPHKGHNSGRVGLFVGASEPNKRPSPQFFGHLGAALLRKGLRPFFLGGPDDVALGQEAQEASGISGSNLCGKHTVAELAEVLRSLALCITPDTGPMHLAAWVGTPVLNLSLGPVHAWETGPRLPGHYILRPRMSCGGCWQCTSTSTHCHSKFHAGRVALVAHTLLHNTRSVPSLHLPGLSLARTTRDARGLYTLESVVPETPSHRMLLAQFWREWFWYRQNSMQPLPPLELAAAALQNTAPALAVRMARCLPRMGKEISRTLGRKGERVGSRGTSQNEPLSPPFWQSLPPLLRPYSGHMQLRLQNAEYSAAAWESVLEDMALLARLFPAA